MAEARRRSLAREAHAKLNVFLRVERRRADGYHEIESLVLPISLADRVAVRRSPALRLDVEGGGASGVPTGPANLALLAALALAERCEEPGGAEITIRKRIPVAGGLGGGSSDAAAVLLALNELWGCGLRPRALGAVAEQLGSDVPAALRAEPVVMKGRGETLRRARVSGPLWWTIVPFDFPVRSPDAYRWWDEDRAPSGPSATALLRAAAAGRLERLGELLFNDLETPVMRRHPEVEEVKTRLIRAGALGAVMSGSGPTVAALARDKAHAASLARRFPGGRAVSGPPRAA
ncbi:MAG: 4-(cytidine 5'-diphospho)-2-C-methyl-D-erythritol kinase [Actinomycetota bacterium]|nr:4-(cytidine 5'-diphospho)-2-C-methyl-D-erythritol kinase [Actinomycetota bacterium]